MAGTGRLMVTVSRGQGLDQILRQHLGASPLRVEVLRELTRQLNPQAFAPGAGHRLLAGARLQLPSADDQVQHAFGRVIAARESASAGDGPVGGGAAAAARKGWVRYP
jgi:Tfp pilus assembly protein FimV